MRQRCCNRNNKRWDRYGERGITVCDRWNDFAAFLSDMGLRPSPQHEIDRVDNDVPYSPENCRWVTKSAQQRNRGGKMRALNLTFNGETLHLFDWAIRQGIPWRTIYNRLHTKGWGLERALTTPVQTAKRAHHSHNRWT